MYSIFLNKRESHCKMPNICKDNAIQTNTTAILFGRIARLFRSFRLDPVRLVHHGADLLF